MENTLRKTVLAGTAGLAIFALASCDRVPEIGGTWQTTQPETLTTLQSAQSNGIIVNNNISSQFIFTPSEQDAHTGDVTIASEITLVDAVKASPAIVTPYEVSVSATSSISGKYTVHDDDEIIITLDRNTQTVDLAPDAVTYNENILTGQQEPMVDSISPRMVSAYSHIISGAVTQYYSRITKMDDIKVRGDVLKFEIHDRDYSLTRVN